MGTLGQMGNWDTWFYGSLIVIVLLIILTTYLQLKQRRRKKAGHGKPSRKGSLFRRFKRDHGARVARLHNKQERSSRWDEVAKAHRLREPACAACGYKGRKIQVHHVKPFHLHPELELDPDNLITLCQARGRSHHLLLGHLDHWSSYNEHVRRDVVRFYKKTAKQIEADAHWLERKRLRPD